MGRNGSSSNLEVRNMGYSTDEMPDKDPGLTGILGREDVC